MARKNKNKGNSNAKNSSAKALTFEDDSNVSPRIVDKTMIALDAMLTPEQTLMEIVDGSNKKTRSDGVIPIAAIDDNQVSSAPNSNCLNDVNDIILESEDLIEITC